MFESARVGTDIPYVTVLVDNVAWLTYKLIRALIGSCFEFLSFSRFEFMLS